MHNLNDSITRNEGLQRGLYDRILYDGDCGLCHRFVRFAIWLDNDGTRFRFSAQTDPLGTVAVETIDGRTLIRSEVTIYVLHRVGRLWHIPALLLSLFPKSLRDWGYNVIAENRHRAFSKPGATCPVPKHPERFL